MDANGKQAKVWAIVIVVVGLVAGYYFWHQSQVQVGAAEQLTEVLSTPPDASGQRTGIVPALLKVQTDYPGTRAGSDAALLAGAKLFEDNKFAEARSVLERFVREHRDSPYYAQALLGLASCHETEGKTNDAITIYSDLKDHYARSVVAGPAQLALARIYEAQGKLEQARDMFEAVARSNPNSSIGSEAGGHYEDLIMKHPELIPKPPPAPTPASVILTNMTPVVQGTNAAPAPPAPATNTNQTSPSAAPAATNSSTPAAPKP
jgi:predicted negative regulator of RcsB-dependent stress response